MAADEARHLKYYTLAFLIPQSGCTPEWEDDGSGVGAFAAQISAIQAAGGNVIISFGGESGGELAQTCTNVSQLTAAYQNVVNTYGVTRLDFDIEGGVLADTAATALRDQALAALQAEDPSVQVDFTVAVSPQGLPTGTGSEYALLQDAKARGEGLSRQHHDHGLRHRIRTPGRRRVRRGGDREPARGPVRDLHVRRLRDDGPDPHRRHQRRRHLLLHLRTPSRWRATFPVYLRYAFQIMKGTNPDGSKYADPVAWVAYFNGGDAVHYFPRGLLRCPAEPGLR